MMPLNCYILDRESFAIKANFRCFTWEINRDYLTNEKSTFLPIDAYNGNQGDIFIAKDGSMSNATRTFADGQHTGFKPLYFGIIDSFNGKNVVACDLYNMLNIQFPATRKTGTDLLQDMNALITRYLLNDQSKNIGSIYVHYDSTVKIAYSYQPSEPPTPTNLTEYFIHCFTKYNVLWDVALIEYAPDNTLLIHTEIYQVTEEISVKNTVYDFANWEVYITPVGINQENKLVICDKATSDMYNPVILSTWYLRTDNGLTQNMNDSVYFPTKDKVYIYDTTATDKPTYQEVAQSELTGNTYSHEINFDMLKNNKMIDYKTMQPGMMANIVFNSILYKSVLTGYLMNNSSEFISLRFGHVRSTFQAIL